MKDARRAARRTHFGAYVSTERRDGYLKEVERKMFKFLSSSF